MTLNIIYYASTHSAEVKLEGLVPCAWARVSGARSLKRTTDRYRKGPHHGSPGTRTGSDGQVSDARSSWPTNNTSFDISKRLA